MFGLLRIKQDTQKKIIHKHHLETPSHRVYKGTPPGGPWGPRDRLGVINASTLQGAADRGVSLPHRERLEGPIRQPSHGTFTEVSAEVYRVQPLVLPSVSTVVGCNSAAQHEPDLNNMNHWSAHTLSGISFSLNDA